VARAFGFDAIVCFDMPLIETRGFPQLKSSCSSVLEFADVQKWH
jgi:hypothetical protein